MIIGLIKGVSVDALTSQETTHIQTNLNNFYSKTLFIFSYLYIRYLIIINFQTQWDTVVFIEDRLPGAYLRDYASSIPTVCNILLRRLIIYKTTLPYLAIKQQHGG